MKAGGGEINSSNRYLKSKWDRSKGLISALTHTDSLIYTCLINCELTLSLSASNAGGSTLSSTTTLSNGVISEKEECAWQGLNVSIDTRN